MADNASLARPYAKAIFELARETASFDAWSLALDQLNVINSDESFAVLVNDPRIEASQLTQLLVDISKQSLPVGGDNFVKLIVQNDRLDALSDIQQLYGELVAKAQESVNASVVTAIALSQEQKKSLESALQVRLGLSVNLEQTIDPSLVGGAIVRAGDLVIDGSVKGRVEKLATTLAR